MKGQNTTSAKIALAYAGLAWGLYWMPLRGLEAAGLSKTSSLITFQALPLLFALPALLLRWRTFIAASLWSLLPAAVGAIAMAIYAAALLHTDVLRAMVLFYLMPAWSILLERIVDGLRITPLRILSILLAFTALSVMFGQETGLPLPQNAGDWLSLSAGLLWSISTVLFHRTSGQSAIDLTTAYFLAGGAAALILALNSGGSLPTHTIITNLWWLVPSVAAIVVTSVLAAMWGVPRVSPSVSGLLFMTEIIAGTLSAALFANEPFGWRQACGVSLIAIAGGLESVLEILLRTRIKPPA